MTKKLFYFLGLIICVWLGGFLGFAYTINNFKVDDSSATDAIVALTGGRKRISEAVELLNKGKAEKLFISGVFESTSLKEIQKSNNVKITTSREISLGKNAKNTVENVVEAVYWAEQNKVDSIRLVTSNYHLPRSMEEFRSSNCDLKIIAHPVFSDKLEKNWWKSWRSFSLIAMEYNKFIFVWIRNHLGFKKG